MGFSRSLKKRKKSLGIYYNMKKIILATRNKGKVHEIMDKLKNYPIEITYLKDYPEIKEIEENGKTYQENAIIKSKTVSNITGLPALADDSGLEIDYLNGNPGIRSSRWGSSDSERINKIIKLLKNTTVEQRNARFVSVMCLFVSNNKYFSSGICSGKITLSPKGSHGFGYDPIFVPNGYERTFAELGNNIKNKISHRAIALEKIVKIIIYFIKKNNYAT